jgi:hypothetical protein
MAKSTRAAASEIHEKVEQIWLLIHFTKTNEYGTHLKKLCKQKLNKKTNENEIKVDCRSGYYPFKIIKEGKAKFLKLKIIILN